MTRSANRISSLLNQNASGFTLIELIIIILVISLLAVGLLIVIDPVERSLHANDTKAQSDIASISKAIHNYVAEHGALGYPSSSNTIPSEIIDSGLLRSIPGSPKGYAEYKYRTYDSYGGICITVGVLCSEFKLWSDIKSRKINSSTYPNPRYMYDSSTNKSCVVDGSDSNFPDSTHC